MSVQTLAMAHPTADEARYYWLQRWAYRFVAPIYDLIALPLASVRPAVVELAGVDEHSRVLDVATGTGSQAIAFAKKAGLVIGIDLSESMLRIARRKNRFPNLILRHADATHLPFRDGAFDVSCISFALHEMPLSIRKRVLREMARVTKVGGTIVVSDYAPPRDRFERLLSRLFQVYEPAEYLEFLDSDVPAWLREAGFDVRTDERKLAGTARILIGHRVT
jgi:ubiquinone/menaquinone biosynthesis C-methylase UbiE